MKENKKTGRGMIIIGALLAAACVISRQFGALIIAVPLLFFGIRRNKAYKAGQDNAQQITHEPAAPAPDYTIPGASRSAPDPAPTSPPAVISSDVAPVQTVRAPAAPVRAYASYSIIKPKSKKALADISKQDYIVFDVETTGLSPNADAIIEIAMIRHFQNGNEQRYHSLFNPRRGLSPKITRITGITDDDLLDAPFIEDRLDEILLFIDGGALVAHNANFDMKFLCAALDAAKVPAEFTAYDTLDMARRAFPDLPNHKLETLIPALSLAEHDQQHRATDDAECTKKLFEICLAELLSQKEAELAARRAARQ